MFFLFSGEGATDMGVCHDAAMRCDGDDFAHGPMAVLVSRIVEAKHGYRPLDTGHYGLATEAALTRRASELKAAKKIVGLPGKKRGKETRFFFNNARVLARIAMEEESKRADSVVAVLFRDCDGTASAGRGLWNEKHRSMLDGFAEEGFSRGVPMLPKPKSEAWVLCALKQNYAGGESLENRSGNDNAPNSLKSELEEHLGGFPTREQLCEMVEQGAIDFQRISMPSFRAFRERLEEVI